MLNVGSYCEDNSDDFDDDTADPDGHDNDRLLAVAGGRESNLNVASTVSPRKRRRTYREVTKSPDAASPTTSNYNARHAAGSPTPETISPSKVLRSSASNMKRSLFQTTRPRSRKIANFPVSPAKQSGRKSSKRTRTLSPAIDPSTIPPWQTLPYHVVQETFFYAAHLQARSSPSSEVHSVPKWLLGLCCVCRDWCEPAIDVLYYSPQLFPERRYNRLLKLLCLPQDEDQRTLFNYHNKIKRLEIRLPQYSLRKWCLIELLSQVPNLKHLRIFETDNDHEIKLYESTARWTDWDALFDALEANNVHLRSWEWNWRLMCPSKHKANLPVSIAASHTRPLFSMLKSLRLQSFQEDMNYLGLTPDTEANSALAMYGETPTLTSMGHALKLLSSTLEEVEVRNSSLLDYRLLHKLPKRLRSLTLHNCPLLTSRNLSSFLATHGRQLEALYLTHNENEDLTMSFTSNLGALCPRLRVFKMGFNFSSTLTPQHHFDGFYDRPIDIDVDNGGGPDWPETLVHLDLERPGRWSEATSVVVFNSLINHAGKLRDLRTIKLSIILMIEWRDRAAFRENWTRRLNKTFLRKSSPPNTSLLDPGTVSADAGQRAGSGSESPGPSCNLSTNLFPTATGAERERETTARGKRHSSRIAGKARKTTYREDSDTDPDYPSPSPTPTPTSARNGSARRNNDNDTADQSSSSSGNSNSNSGNTAKDDAVPYVQGMCDVVEVTVDNLRPANVLMTAENFEDSEVSGDEDWDRDEEVDESYAW